MSDERFHVITNRDVWLKVVEVEKLLSTMSSKLDVQGERQQVHGSKIRALELKVYGIAAGLLAALTILVVGSA